MFKLLNPFAAVDDDEDDIAAQLADKGRRTRSPSPNLGSSPVQRSIFAGKQFVVPMLANRSHLVKLINENGGEVVEEAHSHPESIVLTATRGDLPMLLRPGEHAMLMPTFVSDSVASRRFLPFDDYAVEYARLDANDQPADSQVTTKPVSAKQKPKSKAKAAKPKRQEQSSAEEEEDEGKASPPKPSPKSTEPVKSAGGKRMSLGSRKFTDEEDVQVIKHLIRCLLVKGDGVYGFRNPKVCAECFPDDNDVVPGRTAGSIRKRIFSEILPTLDIENLEAYELSYADMGPFKSEAQFNKVVKFDSDADTITISWKAIPDGAKLKAAMVSFVPKDSMKLVEIQPETAHVAKKAAPSKPAVRSPKRGAAEKSKVPDQPNPAPTSKSEYRIPKLSKSDKTGFDREHAKGKRSPSMDIAVQTEISAMKHIPKPTNTTERVEYLANVTKQSRSAVLTALMLANGRWDIARQVLDGNEHAVRDQLFSSRDDAIIVEFLNTNATIQDPDFDAQYAQSFPSETFDPAEEFDNAYSTVPQMILARGREVVMARVDFLKNLEMAMDARLKLIKSTQ